jgi:lipopolysaccharide transport system ATP-binding protein
MSDTVIQIEHLSKRYRLGVISNGTLWRDIQTWIALKRGREDPNSKIGENKYQNTEDYFWALKDISLEIKQGDRVGIIGKNGAGKSTLLKLLSRITAPTEGRIKIRGKVASLLEVGTGFHGELTGRENVYLNGAILGMKKRRIDQLIDEITAFSGIEHHIDTPVKRYSSGMFVRLAFAVAAHLDSDILIADEVLAVGDAEFQKKALGKMHDLSSGQGRTVLFVSHNMGAVKQLCNCGFVLEKGYIKAASRDIEKLSSDYLNNTQNDLFALRWENKGEFRDPYFTPLSMELQEEDGSKINTAISSTRAYRLELIYKIEIANPLMFFYIGLGVEDSNYFLSAYITNGQYEARTGIYKSYFTIPQNTISSNESVILLYAQLKNTRYIIDGNRRDIVLRIKNVKNDTPLKWYLL